MNPTLLGNFRSRARAESEALYPATVRIAASGDLAGTTSGLKRGENLATGFLADHAITFRVRIALLGAVAFEVGSPIVWVGEGKTFRIDSIKKGNTNYTFGCNAPSSR